MRDNGWEIFYGKVVSSCGKLEIDVPDMDSQFVKPNKSKRHSRLVTNLHYFKHDCFFGIIDLVLKDLNERFTPENIELLHCVSCLSPCDSFKAFDSKFISKGL